MEDPDDAHILEIHQNGIFYVKFFNVSTEDSQNILGDSQRSSDWV